jgi:pyridoxamine 5'-phosphate oxidase
MKTTEEILQLLNSNPVFYLATVENNKPHVRGMLLYKADADGIVFHTGNFKELHRQLQANHSVELCFNSAKTGEQIRVSGEVVEDCSTELIDEIYQHPTRGFLRSMGESIKEKVAVYRITHPKVNIWKMENNFDPTKFVDL